ncbi:MAG: four helix bundle protein [Planctomycetaceae bacterium]|nr:four helix bundle protein [Planctomycetaceae bacterium]
MEREEDNKKHPAAKRFEDLFVWQKAHKMVLAIYTETQKYPKYELYGLVSQMRRAAISVPANIAEGFRKKSKADKVNFLNIAYGSLEETRYYSILSHDLGYCDTAAMRHQIEEVSKLLTMYRSKIDNC